MRKVIMLILAMILGIIPGFFIVFNSVFSDSSGAVGERVFSFFLVVLNYGILAFVIGLFARLRPPILSIGLGVPAVVILVLYSLKEPGLIGLNLVYLGITIASSWLGAFCAQKVVQRKQK